MKRLFDFLLSFLGLLLSSPLMVPVCILIWLQDYHSPFYIALRVGKNEKPFKMVKLRSMVVNADKSGVDSTSNNDNRITAIGRFVRRYKLDEFSQLWNVFKGDMSFVGPRPNVKRETDLYTAQEKRLLSVKPGITDISSIVFSDEGDILKDSADPDLKYNQVIRPWKSRLGLLYVDNMSLWLDVRLIFLTALAIVSKADALAGIQKIMLELKSDSQLRQVAARQEALVAYAPPGMTDIVTSRT